MFCTYQGDYEARPTQSGLCHSQKHIHFFIGLYLLQYELGCTHNTSLLYAVPGAGIIGVLHTFTYASKYIYIYKYILITGHWSLHIYIYRYTKKTILAYEHTRARAVINNYAPIREHNTILGTLTCTAPWWARLWTVLPTVLPLPADGGAPRAHPGQVPLHASRAGGTGAPHVEPCLPRIIHQIFVSQKINLLSICALMG